jgi:hypothetical protein
MYNIRAKPVHIYILLHGYSLLVRVPSFMMSRFLDIQESLTVRSFIYRGFAFFFKLR